jgi:catechol 2,3-dioxygenase-like lactoylglutathione lyase family enzyme
MAEASAPVDIVLAHFIVSDDVERSQRFYTEVLGGRLAFSGPGGLTYVALANTWIIINVGGGPTDDKPTVILETPRDPDRVSSFLNIRVRDIHAVYAEWSARGAQFLTPPKQHQYEIRCYIRDPDRVSSFLNIRVRDIHAVYAEWSARGAQFLTPPKQHQYEIRCYIRDPDGYLIEVGQTTDFDGDWTPPRWPSDSPASH